MAGPRADQRGKGTARDRNEPFSAGELLFTKVSIPRIRPDPLVRTRLLEALDEALQRALTLVCSPAGFGKTTLLADWAGRVKRPVAWVSLDQDDGDPARFWRYVATALERAGVSTGERVRSLLEARGGPSSEELATALVNALQALSEDVALVLDDFHAIQAPSVHEDLTSFVDHLPPQLHVVVASRTDPPLPLARLRARNQIVELRAADLRFTPEESAAFLREVWQLDLSPETVLALESRTEGWAAGLQLAALSLRDRPDPKAFVQAFTGTNRYVLDYLSEEVLERQPDRVRTFLLETSILDRLTGPLCDAVTGGSDGQAKLEELERANLFLVPLDEVRGWWRYHQLFADLLRARLAQEQAERLPALHRAAAAWSEEHGLVDDAVRHGLAAGELTWVARLIEQHWDAMLWRSEEATFRRWLGALPGALVRSRPRLCLAQAYGVLLSGRLQGVEQLLADAEQALADGGDQPREPYEPSVGRPLSLLANLPAAITLTPAMLARERGDAERTAEFAQKALTHLTEADGTLRHFARYYLAMADWLRGRLPEAERALAGLAAEQVAAGARYLAPLYHDLGQVQRARGHLGAAMRTYERALGITSQAGRPQPPAGIPHVDIAEVLYERDELDAALDHAAEGVALSRQLGWARQLASGLAILAWIRHAQGDRAGAQAAITEAGELDLSPEVVDLFNPLPATRARLALADGEVSEAARWVHERGLDADDEPSYPREREYLVLVRVLLAQSEPARALRLLERLDELARAQSREASLIQIWAVRSLALQSVGDHRGALAILADALSLAWPQRFIRVFADEGGPMAALLQSLARARTHDRRAAIPRTERDHLNRVIRAFRLPSRRAGAAAVAGTPEPLIEPLTPRELEILGSLAAGRRNREIAAELVVTLDTVKRHVSHIFDKLGASTRTEAVARARELDLIP